MFKKDFTQGALLLGYLSMQTMNWYQDKKFIGLPLVLNQVSLAWIQRKKNLMEKIFRKKFSELLFFVANYDPLQLKGILTSVSIENNFFVNFLFVLHYDSVCCSLFNRPATVTQTKLFSLFHCFPCFNALFMQQCSFYDTLLYIWSWSFENSWSYKYS